MAEFTYLDIGILAVLFIFLIIGFKRGFIDSILGLIGGVVSLVVAILLADKVAEILYPVFGMGAALEGQVNGFLTKLLNPEGVENNVFTSVLGNQENMTAYVQSLIGEAISKLGLPASFTSGIVSSIATAVTSAFSGTELAEKSLVQILTPVISHIIMIVISVIVTFIAIRIVVAIIEAITKAILKTSRSLRGLNGLLGGIVGVAKGALFVIIIFTIGFFVLSGVQPNSGNHDIKSEARTMVENSKIGKFIYDNNPVPKLITDNINFDRIVNGILGIFNPSQSQSPEPSDQPDDSQPPEPGNSPTPEPGEA
jgi:uncharacterized membrane protein required for colicin V production